MLPFFARAYDHILGTIIGRFVRRPNGPLPSPSFVPATPEEAVMLQPIDLVFEEKHKGAPLEFRSTSPMPAFCPESRFLRGRALGPKSAPAAVIILHGACESEYTWLIKFGEAFARQGFRVLIPAAPAHLERTPKGAASGAALFWNTELTVAGISAWLAEVRALIDWLRSEGAETVGVVGFSLGSLVGGLGATLWPDLNFAALIAPVGSHYQAIRRSSIVRGIWPWMKKVSPEETALLERWAPLNRQPVIADLLFLMTLFDDLQPTELQRAWWQAWGRPPYHEYRHGHLSVLFCKQLYLDLEQFAAARAHQKASSGPVA